MKVLVRWVVLGNVLAPPGFEQLKHVASKTIKTGALKINV
jgi:hypothetical protein